jgi:hypothetical protein
LFVLAETTTKTEHDHLGWVPIAGWSLGGVGADGVLREGGRRGCVLSGPGEASSDYRTVYKILLHNHEVNIK